MFKKLIIPIIAAIAAVGLAFGTGNYSISHLGTQIVPENYYLKPNMDATDALNATNYQETIPTGITCSDADEVPCHYEFTPTIPLPTFQDFLNSKDEISVVADATEKRSKQ